MRNLEREDELQEQAQNSADKRKVTEESMTSVRFYIVLIDFFLFG